MLSITPFLWFDTQAEEAMTFYTSIFPRSKVDLGPAGRRRGHVGRPGSWKGSGSWA